MRILHIFDHSIPLHSGYSFRSLAILKQQREFGWETYHLTGPKQGSATSNAEQVEGYEFHRTSSRKLLASVQGLKEIELMHEIARRIEKVAKQVRPDILHAHSPILNAIPTQRVGRRLGIPVVYEVRAIWEDAATDHGTSREGGLRYRLTRGLETQALRRVDAVITICEGLRRNIIARGIPAEKVTVIPNAVDTTQFAMGGRPDLVLQRKLGLDGAMVLGYIGSFFAYEGLAVLLRALPDIANVRLLLVGGGPQEAKLKQLAQEYGIADRVVFVGRVPHAEVPLYYDLIDVLVYPRLSMPLTELTTPLKPLEAMAKGRLVALSDVGGHRELVRDGETGVLFAPGNPAALAKEITKLVNAPQRWQQIRAAARRFIEAERTWAISVARYREVYARLMQQPRQP